MNIRLFMNGNLLLWIYNFINKRHNDCIGTFLVSTIGGLSLLDTDLWDSGQKSYKDDRNKINKQYDYNILGVFVFLIFNLFSCFKIIYGS